MPECGKFPDPVPRMPPSADSSPTNRRRFVLGLSPRAWLYVAIAFALGVGLFLLIWSKQRGADDFYRPDSSHTGASGIEFEPLPQPATDDTELGQARPTPGDEAEAEARIVETAPPPAPAPVQAPPAATPAAAPTGAYTPPVAISQPKPVYPRAALRRNESGNVLLRIMVGPDGVPTDVSLIEGSGSRYLDRAATDAVRKWRFRPAMRNGQPVSGEVRAPVSFSPQR